MSETSGTYKRSESYLDWDLDNDLVEREEQAKFIRNRRRLVLASVVTIFLLTSIVMVMSVVYVEMNKGVLGFKELMCAENDVACLSLQCPVGWELDPELDHCRMKPGYSCCPWGHHVCGQPQYVRCSLATNQTLDCDCVATNILSSGVSMSGYKQICHPHFIWVDWRQKCLRKN